MVNWLEAVRFICDTHCELYELYDEFYKSSLPIQVLLFELLLDYQYLGLKFTNNGSREEKIKERINE